ncbi:MAG: DUF1906 domain-containing protein [Spirochaetaceae bacterium]|nr:DUF1906 domain-containing protein [Spirochaetaceae bacterium]
MSGTTTSMVRALVVATAAGALALGSAGPVAAAPTSSAAPGGSKTVTFSGVSVSVPTSWPVVRLAGRAGCVRFDRHAVYLGDPTRSTCPPHLVGRTRAVHVTAAGVQGVVRPDLVVRSEKSRVKAVVTAGGRPAAARRIAATVSFARSSAQVTAPSGRSGARTFAVSGDRTLSAGRVLRDAVFTGQGFDACTARSLSELSAWYASSPYKAVNMYIGGASRGCSQPNLNAAWVSGAVAQGWVLIPTYVGLQAPCRDYPNRIDPANAVAQGAAAADDAIAQLNALGLGIGNPIYFDMEAFSMADDGCRQAVVGFLDAWTAQLHARGYVSGVYGSANSTIRALVQQLPNPAFDQPDHLWIARWCDKDPAVPCDSSTNDPEVPADRWKNHQRIRQYRGGHLETWGGVTINIDNNTVDAAVAPTDLAAESAFVQVAGHTDLYRIAGGAPVFVSSWESVNQGPQPVQTLSQTQFDSLPDRPEDGTFLTGGASGAIYRVSGGIASHVPSWTPYGGPQPTTTVDQAALDNAGTGGVWNQLSSGTPTVSTTGPTTLGSIASGTRFTWAGGVSSSAVASYDVRWRRARWDGRYDAWRLPASWQATANLDAPLGMKAGYTYCVSVRARNRAGQLSAWTGSRCLSRALDDRRLAASAGWRTRSGGMYYGGTFRATTVKGATLTRIGAKLKRIGVVATTCRVCGVVNVLVDGKKVGRLDLAAPSTRRRQVLMLPAFTRQSGTITVKVRSSGKRVQIDGIVVSRA